MPQMGTQRITADAQQRRGLQLVTLAQFKSIAHQRVDHPLVEGAIVTHQLLAKEAVQRSIPLRRQAGHFSA
ncbi:hypothetical protein D3C72_1195490 [compost metagenome]